MSSGSNLRRSTTVEASGSARVKCAKPHEWNMGAAIMVVSRARRGILEKSAATGSIESGCLRAAPLGVPVVPDVRMTTLPRSAGAFRSESSPCRISSSSKGSGGRGSARARGSLQAMNPIRRERPAAISSPNSSS